MILKDIGLGASLYLLLLKIFAILFFVLTIVNIPIIIIYLNGLQIDGNTNFSRFLATLTLGNKGESTEYCQRVKLQEGYTNVNMHCIGGKLKVLAGVGMSIRKY
jgi:hypothetical protein